MLQVIAGSSPRHQQLIASSRDLQHLLLSALAFKLHWAVATLSRAGLLPSSAVDSRFSASGSISSSSGSGSVPLVCVFGVLVDVGSVLLNSKWAAGALQHANTYGPGTAGLLEPLVQACCAPLATSAQCQAPGELSATLLAQQTARMLLRDAAGLLLSAAREANRSTPSGQAKAQHMTWAAVRLMPPALAATRRLLAEQPGPTQLPDLHRYPELVSLHSDSPPASQHAGLLMYLQATACSIALPSPAQLPACAAAAVAALQLLPLVPQLQLAEPHAVRVTNGAIAVVIVASKQAHDSMELHSEVIINPATAKQLCYAHTLACRLVHASISPSAELSSLTILGDRPTMLRLEWAASGVASQGLLHTPPSPPASADGQEQSR